MFDVLMKEMYSPPQRADHLKGAMRNHRWRQAHGLCGTAVELFSSMQQVVAVFNNLFLAPWQNPNQISIDIIAFAFTGSVLQ